MWKGTRDAFAAVVPAADSQITVNLRYAGQYADAETGLYYNGFRYYDPLTGRYLQPDPLGLSGGLNSYTYALNNPLRYIDPEGQNPLALLPWIGYLAVGWVIGEAMDYLIGYLPDNECNPLLSLQRWANAASYAVTMSSAQKGVKALTAAAKLRRGLGGRGAGAENTEKIASGGAIRAEKYSNNWSTGNLDKAINKFAGKNPIITTTEKGKRIYTNPTTGIQVVEDMSGNYFRIYNPNISGRRSYLDLNGNIPNNKFLENGKQTGRSQSEYNKVTHFNIKRNK